MRLLIDTTAININKQPLTGIPRVVHNYLKFGYVFGSAHKITVLPVSFVDDALVLQRPSSLFPHPPGLPQSARRVTAQARVLQLAFFVALGLAHVPYVLAWVWFFFVPSTGKGSRSYRATRRLSGPLHHFKTPARYLWARYMKQATVDPQPDDILFAPAYWHDVDPAVLAALTGTMRARYVLVHDIIPVTHPQYYHAPWRDEFRQNVGAAIDGFSAVLAISQYTADSIRTHFPSQSAGATISVARNGLEPLKADGPVRESLLQLFKNETAPCLMVGTIEPKKGHLDVLQALKCLWDGGQSGRKLVILGRTGWMYDEIVAALRKAQGEGHVVWLEDASDAELAFAYRNAHLMIQASHDEGFGLPMVEAAISGCPVVARRSPIAQEVLGASGLYFDTAQELQTILAKMESPEAQTRQRAVMADFDWPHWQAVVPAVFQALVDHSRGLPLPTTIHPPA